MVPFLTFLQDYEMVLYYLLGLIALRYLYLYIVAQVRLSKANFGLERELFQGQRNGAVGKFLLSILAGVGIYLAVQYGLPEAQRVERIRINANAASLPTITPTATPFELFGVDVSGCNNPQAQIRQPHPGDTVKGKADIVIVADIPGFAFYTIELSRPDEPDVWITLFNDNLAATDKEPYSWTWDSSTVSPGVYHLRLTVMDADLTYPPPCVVPIQVLGPEPGQ